MRNGCSSGGPDVEDFGPWLDPNVVYSSQYSCCDCVVVDIAIINEFINELMN